MTGRAGGPLGAWRAVAGSLARVCNSLNLFQFSAERPPPSGPEEGPRPRLGLGLAAHCGTPTEPRPGLAGLRAVLNGPNAHRLPIKGRREKVAARLCSAPLFDSRTTLRLTVLRAAPCLFALSFGQSASEDRESAKTAQQRCSAIECVALPGAAPSPSLPLRRVYESKCC